MTTVLFEIQPASEYGMLPFYFVSGLIAFGIIYRAIGLPLRSLGHWYRVYDADARWLLALTLPIAIILTASAARDRRDAQFQAYLDGDFELVESAVLEVKGSDDGQNRDTEVIKPTRYNLTFLRVEGRTFRLGREAGKPIIRYRDPNSPPLKIGDQVRIWHRDGLLLRLERVDRPSS